MKWACLKYDTHCLPEANAWGEAQKAIFALRQTQTQWKVGTDSDELISAVWGRPELAAQICAASFMAIEVGTAA